ncbi:MAG: hypothetical protein R8P61_14985 [Bacteroidia bacterium]|nr:hypothetical protein [Bacteroidia bacterium]
MNKFLLYIFSALLLFPAAMSAQDAPAFSLRLSIQPQVSALNPYDAGFISSSERVIPSLAFGIEASKSINKKLELSVGYFYSNQAGNFSLVECSPSAEFVAGNRAVFDPIVDRVGPSCPLPRHNINLIKIPVSLGWKVIRKDNYMGRLGFGPQIQFLLTPPNYGLYDYKGLSAAFMLEWANYFKVSNNISLVAGIRADRSLSAIDHNYDTPSLGNTLGISLGIEYSHWKQKK